MKNKFGCLFEGNKGNETPLNRIFTSLYIIEGEREGVNEEHEVLRMEKTPRTHSQGTPVNCNDIFDLLPKPGCEQQKLKNGKTITVLTKGIAGIGKTISVQKFILDWAEGKANQDVDFMFMLPFRELNLVKDDQCDLHRLLLEFYPELRDLNSKIFNKCKTVFIFDGLDESRITLKFSDSEKVAHVTETSSAGELMSNLIKGELLPSALIWITSRPAAANQIPSEYINRVTEIQGFSEPQKEEYFRKRITDENQATKIISHIRRARSLHIMCHIPVFCWISAMVFQNILTQDHSAEIPKTLTEMYIYFLLIQTNMKNEKYNEKAEKNTETLLESNKDVIVKLAELAFKQLIKGNVMFYEEDLRDCGIDITDASVYSGICTEIFKQESVIYQRKVYCFIHLSFQEFLAAVFVFHCFVSKNLDVLQFFDLLHSLQREAVDKALQSDNGHLDLFLRFLLGISLDFNQRLLQGLLTHTTNSSESIKKTITYIKDKIKNGPSLSAERSINLFLCLHEMNDPTLYEEIQEFLKSKKLSGNKLSAAHCSAIAHMLQMSEEVLDKLDLMKYNTSDEVLFCNTLVASALQSSTSPLRQLDLSNNDLHDSGLKLLSAGLKSPHCKLNILRLSGCMVTEEGCSYLVSALKSNPSHLKELDLSYNHPEDSGIKLLSELLEDPQCTLEKLNVNHCGQSRITPGLQKYVCELALDPNTAHVHLCLSDGNRKVTYVQEKQLYPDHLERFKDYEQVLCSKSLTGRCYWEVEWSGFRTDVAVTYKRNSREGEGHDDRFGLTKNSWALIFYNNNYYVRHNNKRTDIPVPSPPSNRVGVYLDSFAGTLSFYSVSSAHTLTHLHTFHSTFTKPLYAGFRIGVDSGSSVSLCKRETL
uniref:B30.2/SPRY domain-containing protein n=1 Tax=Sinocyclocheilus rhinocerous TaxID=307959 RepID=A0A673KLQ2_9TELE